MVRWPKCEPKLYSATEKISGHAGFYSRGRTPTNSTMYESNNSSLYAKTMTIE